MYRLYGNLQIQPVGTHISSGGQSGCISGAFSPHFTSSTLHILGWIHWVHSSLHFTVQFCLGSSAPHCRSWKLYPSMTRCMKITKTKRFRIPIAILKSSFTVSQMFLKYSRNVVVRRVVLVSYNINKLFQIIIPCPQENTRTFNQFPNKIWIPYLMYLLLQSFQEGKCYKLRQLGKRGFCFHTLLLIYHSYFPKAKEAYNKFLLLISYNIPTSETQSCSNLNAYYI